MKKIIALQSKNIKTILVVLIFININPKNSSSQWIQQKLPLNAGLLISMDFVSSGTGLLGGWQLENEITGRLYRSDTNGTNWYPVIFPDSVRAITGIEMIDESFGYICGAYNLSALNSPVSKEISSAFDINADIPGYKYGMTGSYNYKAIFLRSLNGGDNWDAYGSINPEYDYLTSMSFKNKDTGVAVASIQDGVFLQSKIIKTINGGLDWNELKIPANVKEITSILYSDANVIYATGTSYQNNGIIIYSADNGNTWAEWHSSEVIVFNEINFPDPLTGFVSAMINSPYPVSKIYKTTNSGNTWNALKIELDSIIINECNFNLESGIGYVFCNKTVPNNPPFRELSNLIIGKTTDLGETWQISELQDIKSLYCSKFIDSMEIYASGGYIQNNYIEGYLLHTTNGGILSVSNENDIRPEPIKLYQNHPNPFNPVTTIRFDIEGGSLNNILNVKLTVYNNLGKTVKILADQNFSEGSYEVKFDGNDLPSGIYFYNINIGNFTETKKMILLK